MAVELSILIGVGSYLYPRDSRAYHIGRAIWVFMKTLAVSTLAAEEIIFHKVLHTTKIGILIGGGIFKELLDR